MIVSIPFSRRTLVSFPKVQSHFINTLIFCSEWIHIWTLLFTLPNYGFVTILSIDFVIFIKKKSGICGWLFYRIDCYSKSKIYDQITEIFGKWHIWNACSVIINILAVLLWKIYAKENLKTQWKQFYTPALKKKNY